MIKGINDAKKTVFIWMFVFLVLCIGLCVTFYIINNNAAEADKATDNQMLMLYGGSFLFSCLPIGLSTRRRFLKWYAHVPTEEIKVFETQLPVALWRLIKCAFLAGLNLALFAIYTAMAIVIGPFMNFYAIISGIVYMCKKKI